MKNQIKANCLLARIFPLLGLFLISALTAKSLYADELKIDLRYFSYENDLAAKKSSFFAGEFMANKFGSDTRSLRLNLNEKNPLKGSLSVHDNFLNIETHFFMLDFNIDEIPFYSNINFINFINLSYLQSDDRASFELERIHFKLFDYEVFYRNLKGKCESLVGQELSFIDSCLNNSKVETINTTDETALGRVRADDLSLDFSVQELDLSERQILFSTNNLALVVGTFNFEAELLSLRCSKQIYSDKTDDKRVVKDCLASGDISMPVMKIRETDLALEGELSVKSFLSNPTKMTFVSDALNIKLGNADIVANTIFSECKTPNLDDQFEYMDIPYSCLGNSIFKMGGFSYVDESISASFVETILKLDELKIALISPQIKINLPQENLDIVINNANIECDKLFEKNITADSLLVGCFNSSKVKVSNITFVHPSIDTQIKIETIEFDKNSFHLKSSKGGYSFNDQKNRYKELDFNCKIDASYELAKNLDWKSILKNCIHNSKIKLGSLSSKYNGGGFFKKIYSQLKAWGIQGVKSVDFESVTSKDSVTSRNDEFVMDIYPTLIGFIPAGGKLYGYINYDEEKNIIKIEVKEFNFYKVIPGKAALMFILNAFVTDESIDVSGDIITISLD